MDELLDIQQRVNRLIQDTARNQVSSVRLEGRQEVGKHSNGIDRSTTLPYRRRTIV
jgi:hypothetical protein